MELLGAIITLLGSIFLLLGALGIVRMPDVYNRMQAGAKATTLGSIFFLLGISVGHHQCGCVGKVIILILFKILSLLKNFFIYLIPINWRIAMLGKHHNHADF